MKYERLTKKFKKDNGKETPKCFANNIFAVSCDIDCEECWISKINHRLCELEDKIERGELISTKEVGDTEIEFFVKHNDKVRKETVQQVLIQAAKIMNSISWSHYDGGKAVRILEKIAEAYGVELFENFDKLENCNE